MPDIRKIAEEIESSLLSDEEITSSVTQFIPSGSTLLDLALGGGWAIRRVINIIGDEATGKSQLAAEAGANAIKQYNAVVIYDDPETTFDGKRAEIYGINPGQVIYKQSDTVEEVFDTVIKLLNNKDYPEPLVYILDSLDAVSSKAEMKRDMMDDSYGGEKPKKMSEGFRRIARLISKHDAIFIVVSQTRAKIGITFGEKTDISGGRALKYYASQRIKLSQIEKIKDKNKNIYGATMKAKVIKNKVATPYKEAQFDILFDLGVDDVASNVDYYKEHTEKAWDGKKFKGKYDMVAYIEENNQEEQLKEIVKEIWTKYTTVELNRKK